MFIDAATCASTVEQVDVLHYMPLASRVFLTCNIVFLQVGTVGAQSVASVLLTNVIVVMSLVSGM